VQTTSTGKYSLDSAGTDFVKLDYGVAKLISQISPHVSNELLYQYGRELNDEGLQPITAYDKQYMITPDGNDPYNALDVSNIGFYVGAPYYSFRPAYPEEWKWQIGDDLYYQRGRHNFKFGVDMVHNYRPRKSAAVLRGLLPVHNQPDQLLCRSLLEGFDCRYLQLRGQLLPRPRPLRTPPALTLAGTSMSRAMVRRLSRSPPMDQGYFAARRLEGKRRAWLCSSVCATTTRSAAGIAILDCRQRHLCAIYRRNQQPHQTNWKLRPARSASPTICSVLERPSCVAALGSITAASPMVTKAMPLQATGSPLAQTVPNISVGTSLAADPVWPNRFSAAQETSSVKPAAYYRSTEPAQT
jgi:hypothetical protein